MYKYYVLLTSFAQKNKNRHPGVAAHWQAAQQKHLGIKTDQPWIPRYGWYRGK